MLLEDQFDDNQGDEPLSTLERTSTHTSSFVQGFHPSRQEAVSEGKSIPQLHLASIDKNAKHKSHRKRHVPVGPAGVWFQTQQQHSIENQRIDKNSRGKNIDDEDEDLDDCNNKNRKFSKSGHANNSNSQSFHNLAWTAAQCSLGYATPNWSALLQTSQKYSIIRRQIPKDFVLIRDIYTTMVNDWKLRNGQKLLVMVNTMKAVMGDNYLWTVGLTDETGSFIQAWIQPSFVQKEQQRSTPQYLRVGVVWMLKNVTLAVGRRALTMVPFSGGPANDEDDDDDDMYTKHVESEIHGTVSGASSHQLTKPVERTLLISESNIEQVWSSVSEKEISHEAYIKWVEQRNNATLLASKITADIDEANATSEYNAAEHPESDDDNHDGHHIKGDLMHAEGFLSSSTAEQEFRDDDDDTFTSVGCRSTKDFKSSNVEIKSKQSNMIPDDPVRCTNHPSHPDLQQKASQKCLNPESFQFLRQNEKLEKPSSQSTQILDSYKRSTAAENLVTDTIHTKKRNSEITAKKSLCDDDCSTNISKKVGCSQQDLQNHSIKENESQQENLNPSLSHPVRFSANSTIGMVEQSLVYKRNYTTTQTDLTVTNIINTQAHRLSSTLSTSQKISTTTLAKTKEPCKLWSSSHDSRLMAMLDEEENGDDED